MKWEKIIKKPFVYGEDHLPSEEMNKFLLALQDVIWNHNSTDKEVIDLADRLEDFLAVGGSSGRNLSLKDRVKRISGKKSKLDEFHQRRNA
jgi:hypothetical protein